MNETLN